MKSKCFFGIEIESAINERYSNIDKEDLGEYHEGNKLLSFWKVERDGSLNASLSSFLSSFSCEFVSDLLKSKQEFFKALEEFKYHLSHNGKYELNKVIDFNTSCGCHIHFSFNNGKNFKFKEKVFYELFKEMRELFFKKLNDNQILNEELKEGIKEHYNRSYATIKTKKYFFNFQRYNEFNFGSEIHNQGLEWRSFNLRGLKKWKEFDEMFKICWECLDFLLSKIKKGWISKNKKIRVNKKEIEKSIKKPFEEIELNNDSKKEEIINLNCGGIINCVI